VAQDTEEDTTEPAAKTSARTKRRASVQDRQEVRVLFTGIVSKALEKDIQTLGGQVVSDVAHCDVLLTDKVRRTTKFLEALAAGKPIVDDQWLEASRASHSLAPADDHLLVDKEREATYGFSLREAVQAAREAPAFADKTFFVTKTLTSPPPGELKAMIGFAGGRIVSNARSADFVIGTDKDKKKSKEPIHSAELILTGILRQKLEPDQFQL
jgi:NAD-dependent DNA ligase